MQNKSYCTQTLPKLSITLIEKPLAGPQHIRMQKFDSKNNYYGRLT